MFRKKIIFLFVLILMLTSIVSAFGVASPYWSGNPLILGRGETQIVDLNLQNMVGEEDVKVKAELVAGSEITFLPKEIYKVKAGTHDTMVSLKIKIPKEAEVGDVKTISIDFKTISEDIEGVSLGTGMVTSFDVIVSGEAVKSSSEAVVGLLILAIIILVIVIWFVLKRKKNSR